MADRIYPSSKPNSNPPPQALNGTTNPSFPATKAQLYGATRPPYRPQPKPRRRHRSCCCCCCLWITLFIIALILLTAIAGAVFWVLYRPQRPSFTIKSLQVSQFNITTPKNSSPHLNSKLNLTISARNPNKKIVFFYDPIYISMKSNGIDIGNGSFPTFVHESKNTTNLKALVSSVSQDLDSESATSLNSDLKKKNELPLVIDLETQVKVKIGSFKTDKVRIKVTCKGIQASVQKGKASTTSDAKCKVNLRIKIWKWTF